MQGTENHEYTGEESRSCTWLRYRDQPLFSQNAIPHTHIVGSSNA